MRTFRWLTAWVLVAVAEARGRRDRGDVPGWVMVTVMTAILVVAIIGIFKPQITRALSGIVDSVSNAGDK
jgi:hypothetical protein